MRPWVVIDLAGAGLASRERRNGGQGDPQEGFEEVPQQCLALGSGLTLVTLQHHACRHERGEGDGSDVRAMNAPLIHIQSWPSHAGHRSNEQ